MIVKIKNEKNFVYYSPVFAIDYRHRARIIVFDENYNKLKIIPLFGKRFEYNILFVNYNCENWQINEDKFKCFWNDKNIFSKIKQLNNNCSILNEAKSIKNASSYSKWNIVKTKSDLEALLNSTSYFHDSYIVKSMKYDDGIEILINTTWGAYAHIKANGILENKLNEHQVYFDCNAKIEDGIVSLHFILESDKDEVVFRCKSLMFDVYFEQKQSIKNILIINNHEIYYNKKQSSQIIKTDITKDYFNYKDLNIFGTFEKDEYYGSFNFLVGHIVYSFTINKPLKHTKKEELFDKKLIFWQNTFLNNGYTLDTINHQFEYFDIKNNYGDVLYTENYSKLQTFLRMLKFAIIPVFFWNLFWLIIQLCNPNMKWITFLIFGVFLSLIMLTLYSLIIFTSCTVGQLTIYENAIISSSPVLYFNLKDDQIINVKKTKRITIYTKHKKIELLKSKNNDQIYKILLAKKRQIDMSFEQFRWNFIKTYASNVSKNKLKKHVLGKGNYIWHLFSWELLDSKEYLKGEEAKKAYDLCDKENAIVCLEIPYTSFFEINKDFMTSDLIEGTGEVYVFAKDMSWVYIGTHEESIGLGPYFISKKN